MKRVKDFRLKIAKSLFLTLFSILIAFVGPTVYGHDFGGPTTSEDEPPPPPDQPPCDDGSPCCNGPGGSGNSGNRSGSPISYWNGGESITATDLVVNGEFPIRITRKYDSLSSYDSPLGYGWAFLHDRRLYEYSDNSVVIRHGCGTRDKYIPVGGAYAAPVGGTFAKLIANTDGTYIVKYLNGTSDYFDTQGRLTANQDEKGNRHEYSYDTRGKLPLVGTSKSALNPLKPLVVAYNYRLTKIKERGADGVLTGRWVSFAYDESTGRLTKATANDGRFVTYVHDIKDTLTQGNLTEVHGLESTLSTYDYADPLDSHNLTSFVPDSGQTPVINHYDDQDRVDWQDEGTRHVKFDYVVPLTKSVVTQTIRDADGLNPYDVVTSYEFDSSGRITTITDAKGNQTRYKYNGMARLWREEVWQKTDTGLTLLKAKEWDYFVDGHKRSETVTLDGGEVVTRTWSWDHDKIASRQAVSSVSPGKIFRTEYTFYYDTEGRPTNIKDEKRLIEGSTYQVFHYTYDSRKRLESTTLPDNVVHFYEYDGDFLSKSYFKVGGVAIAQKAYQYHFDARGFLDSVWDARSNLTQLSFDGLGRIKTITNPLQEQFIYTYTGFRLTKIERGHTAQEGEGQVVKYSYDGRYRLASVSAKNDSGAYVKVADYGLDSEGQLLFVKDGEYHTTKYTYDLDGYVSSIKDPSSKLSQFEYDAAGNLTLYKDPLLHETSFEYDDLDRLIKKTERGESPNVVTQYSYDAVGNLLNLIDPNLNTTSYGYDALSRRTSVKQDLGQTVNIYWDSRDRIDYVVNARSQKIKYDYYKWGPMQYERDYASISATTADRTITYKYDDDAHVTNVSDTGIRSGDTYVMTYDNVGRLFDETFKYISGGDRVLQHRYDRYGNQKSLTLVEGLTSTPFIYNYNKLNLIGSATLDKSAISLGYYNDFRIKNLGYPGGINTDFVYKNNGLLTSVTVTGASGQLEKAAYTYYDNGNVDTLTDSLGVHNFDYDGLDRLTQATQPSGSGLSKESYVYDPSNNRKDPLNQSLWVYDGNNRINNSPGLGYTYDNDGNLLIRSDGATFTHDANNRLTQFVKGTTTGTYINDSLGRRIKKTVGSTTSVFLWDGGRLLAQYNGSGTKTAQYGYLGGMAVPIQFTGNSFISYDGQLAPRLITDNTGKVIWKAKFQAYGKSVVTQDPDLDGVSTTFNLRFAGQYYDSESGLYYNFQRYYDPATGRYIERDPIGLAGGINPYAYVEGNPLSNADPTGTNAVSGAIAGGEAGFIAGGPAGAGVGAAIGAAVGALAQAGAMAGAMWVGDHLGEALRNLLFNESHDNSSDGTGDNDSTNDDTDSKDDCANASVAKGNRKTPQKGDTDTTRDGSPFSWWKPEPQRSNQNLRNDWAKNNNTPWPKDPETGKNQDVSHIGPRADGYPDHWSNVEPKPHGEHMAEHQSNGDFSRWGQRRY